MTDTFRDRVAVITGGAGGIGRALARAFAERGAHLVLADIDEERTKAVAKKLPAGKAEVLQLDVSDSGALRRALADADFAINGLIPEYNLDVMNACLETNTNYLDMAAGGPRDIVGTADVDEQLGRGPAIGAVPVAVRRRGLSAEQIRELRLSIGLSQKELAEKIGVSVNSISNWETGRTAPRTRSVHEMLALAVH